VALTPGDRSALANLGLVLKAGGAVGGAIAWQGRALAIHDDAGSWNNLGDSLQATGDVGGALVAYRRSVELGGSAAWHSNLVFCLCYDERVTSEALFGEVRAWAARHAPKTGSKPMRRAVSGRPRVGVLSSDLRDHPVGRNVLGVFEHHRRVSLHGYAEVAREDATTARFRSHAEGWTSTVGMGDEQVAERMRKDGLDLLIVLAGHTAKNRPLVAAFGGAPVQASFHDLTTSGLEAMDWWITDGVLHPEGTKERFTEKLWRLPHFYLHRPPDEAPDVGPLPSEAGGHITFVSCNNPAKLTDGVVRLWSQVLKGVPGSRLLLKYVGWFGDEVVRSRIVGRFEANGIGRERLDLRATDLVRKEQLGLLNEADIALDPFPFNGSTTTFEALWMGVPVVTLQGERFVGRVGASVLSALDLPELIASDEEAYVAAAVALAGDRERLAGLRRSLRPRIAASPICDAAGYTRSVETALIEMAGG
jgi:predicted O-linked N-acetylglucosamine transferase (SPINDLY family)